MRNPALITVSLVAALIALAVALGCWVSDLDRLLSLTGAVQSIVTILAIVVGGFWAYRKVQVFRDFEPHLTIVQKVSHRDLSPQYVHVFVNATLYNGSKVKIEVREANFWLQRMGPLTDDEAADLYAQVFIDGTENVIQWPIYDEVKRTWNEGELVIEPGESHHESYEFIVSKAIGSILAYAYFKNLGHKLHARNAPGWSVTTAYDIMQ